MDTNHLSDFEATVIEKRLSRDAKTIQIYSLGLGEGFGKKIRKVLLTIFILAVSVD